MSQPNMSPPSLESFLIIPCVRQLLCNTLHTRYQVPFCLWQINPKLKCPRIKDKSQNMMANIEG